MFDAKQILETDLKYVWHPFTQMKTLEENPPVVLTGAEGVYLHTADGRKLLDGISSWWVNALGHKNPVLDKAITDQLQDMAHVMFALFTHKPGTELAKLLIDMAPERLQRVFYSDNGSTAVEIALKLAHQYYLNRGETRAKFICFNKAYHGDTIGTVSVGDVGVYHDRWRALCFPSLIAPCPYPGPGEDAQEKAQDVADAVETLLKGNAGEVAGIIIEPLMQGAGGMLFHHPDLLRHLRELCDRYDVKLIFDEVATGFWRTGKAFAANHADVSPDFMAVSKALTGGYLPLGATLISEEIFRGFDAETFYHGHSFTGNPLATAVACATLKIMGDSAWQKDLKERAEHLQAFWRQTMTGLDHVDEVRGEGFIAALSLKEDVKTNRLYDPARRLPLEVCFKALESDLFIRPLGNVIYFLPPLTTKRHEVEWAIKTIAESIKQVTKRA